MGNVHATALDVVDTTRSTQTATPSSSRLVNWISMKSKVQDELQFFYSSSLKKLEKILQNMPSIAAHHPTSSLWLRGGETHKVGRLEFRSRFMDPVSSLMIECS